MIWHYKVCGLCGFNKCCRCKQDILRWNFNGILSILEFQSPFGIIGIILLTKFDKLNSLMVKQINFIYKFYNDYSIWCKIIVER